MNWLLIVVGVIFLVSIVVGAVRGAVKIVVSLATTLVTLVLVFFLTPYVSDAIMKYTPLDEVIESEVSGTMADAAVSALTGENENGISADAVKRALNAAGVSEEMLAGYGISIDDIVNGNVSKETLEQYGISSSVLDGVLGGSRQAVEETLEGAEIPRDLQIEAIQGADLPEVFKHLLSVNNNSEVYQQLGAETFVQYVGSYLARLIVNIISFLIAFLLITIIVRAVVFALDIVSSLPGIGFLNRLAGGALGIAGALIIVWTLYIIITLLYTTSIGKMLFEMIQSDQFLSVLYEYNPIMKLATIFR